MASAQAPGFELRTTGPGVSTHAPLSQVALFGLQLSCSRTHLLGAIFQPPTGEPECQNAHRTSARSAKAEADAGKLEAAGPPGLRLREQGSMQAEGPMPEGVTASVAPDRGQRVKAPGSEDRRLEAAAGERGHDRLKRSRRRK